MRVVGVMEIGLGEFADDGVLSGGLRAWQWSGGALPFDTLFNCSTSLLGHTQSHEIINRWHCTVRIHDYSNSSLLMRKDAT